MDDLTSLIDRVQNGEIEAFTPIVEKFQDMVVGYAYAILGDFHKAEDAAQDAFIVAFLNLESIREPAAFPGWMRRIVFTQCSRMRRSNRLSTVELDEAMETQTKEPTPDEVLEKTETSGLVRGIIESLPDLSPEAITLFYISDLSHAEIAAFLEVPVSTVEKRLHDGQKRTIPVYAVPEPETVADELVLQFSFERAINNKHPKVAAYLLDKGADVIPGRGA